MYSCPTFPSFTSNINSEGIKKFQISYQNGLLNIFQSVLRSRLCASYDSLRYVMKCYLYLDREILPRLAGFRAILAPTCTPKAPPISDILVN